MQKRKKVVAKIFRVVSLGDEISNTEIQGVLVNAITLDPKRPETFFTVVDCTEEITNLTELESRAFLAA